MRKSKSELHRRRSGQKINNFNIVQNYENDRQRMNEFNIEQIVTEIPIADTRHTFLIYFSSRLDELA
jgi:hypothetical protein